MLVAKEVLLGNSLEKNIVPIRKNPHVRLLGNINNKRTELCLSAEDLSTHTLATGGTGSGKTNVIFEITRQIKGQLTAEDVMIIFDTKRDFLTLRDGRDVVISNSLEDKSDNLAYRRNAGGKK